MGKGVSNEDDKGLSREELYEEIWEMGLQNRVALKYDLIFRLT